MNICGRIMYAYIHDMTRPSSSRRARPAAAARAAPTRGFVSTPQPTAAAQLHAWEHTNHAVLAVGWGVEPQSQREYWIAMNTWGPDWGERGFFRIARGDDESAHTYIYLFINLLIYNYVCVYIYLYFYAFQWYKYFRTR